MTRLLGLLLGLVLLCGLVLAPAAFYGLEDSGGGSEPTSISRYDVDMVVRADGSARVRETIVLEVSTYDRHGIFRFFDRADSAVDGGRVRPRDVEVLRDGAREDWVTESSGAGRYLVWRIGDADVTLTPGSHTYRLTYELADVLTEGEDGRAELRWDVVPGGWAQRIDEAEVSLRLPAATLGEVRCDQGQGVRGGCTAVGGGTDRVVVVTGPLAPRTPVTVTAALDLPAPAAQETLPWAPRLDPVLGTRVWLLVVVVLLGLLALAYGALLAHRARERQPGLPLTYAPPAGLGPAQGYYVARERIGRERYVASLLHAAERGALTLVPHDDGWTIQRHGDPRVEADLDDVTRQVIGVARRGGSFTFTRKSVEAGKRLKRETDEFEAAVRQWGRDSGTVVRAGLGGFGGVLVLLAAGLAVVAVVVNPFGMSAWALLPGGLAVGAAPLLVPGSGTRRTSLGRRLWSEVGGFERVLSTPSSKQRFDFGGRHDLYTAYVPWAVAFDCAKEWAAKYRFEVGEDPPAPHWAAWYAGSSGSAWTDRIAHDLEQSVDSAISAYNATQSSSSSGGGGGGGGGSW